jgi:hypothetical protein
MTAIQPRKPGLADAVRAGAAGLYSLEAACDLVTGAGWLHRDDFTRFISTGTSLTGGVTELACINWQSVISSRDAGLLPCSSGENRILRLAASVERRSGFPWREAVAAPGTPMVTPGHAGSLAAAPRR